MTTLRQDLRYALRMLGQTPGFTAVAALSLALGIGANSAIFSMMDSIVLRSLSFHDPGQLVMVWHVPQDHPDQNSGLTVPDYMVFKEYATVFDSYGAIGGFAQDFGAEENGAAAERIIGQTFSPGMFRVLGVQPLMGRFFTEEEAQIDSAAPVIVISHELWQRRFAGSLAIVNKLVRLDGVPNTIIGVMPQGVRFFDDNAQFWRPQQLFRAQLQGSARSITLAARLKAGSSIEQAQSAMDVLSTQLANTNPADKGWKIRLQPMHEAMFGWMRSPLLLLQTVVGFVLLIACANVAGLLMARASSRQIEVAVRTAIGASRGRIIRQLLTESILLSTTGGALGVLFAWWGLRVLVNNSPNWVPRIQDVGIHPRVLGFTLALSILTGLVFGVVPALRGSKLDLSATLKESGRTGDSLSHDRLRGALVTLQIALSLVLLIGAGLFINTFLRLQSANVGFDVKGVLAFDFRFPNAQMIKRVGNYNGFPLLEVNPRPPLVFRQILDKLQTTPGILSAAGISRRPLDQGAMQLPFTIIGRAKPPVQPGAQDEFTASTFIITPNFFQTLKVELRGRDFTLHDDAGSSGVAIVNQTMARRFWPNEDPIGKQLKIDLVADEQPREIIAVVGDVPLSRWDEKPGPIMYVPSLQQGLHWRAPFGPDRIGMTFIARSAADPMNLVASIRRLLAEVDPDKPPTDIQTVEQYLGNQLDGPRQYTFLLGLFGAIATILAATGIYSVMSFSVAQRRREIGIRMALGASTRDVMGLVIRRALILISIGLLLGLIGSWALTRLVAQQLWGVTATDPLTFVSAAIALTAIALLASIVPTRQAVAVDPTIALRHE